jgi:NTE family protein
MRGPGQLLLFLFLPVLLSGCGGSGEAHVSGSASWRGMGIEGVSLRATPVAADTSPGPSVSGRTTYHGAFLLSLPPGRWRIEARGEVPFGGGNAALSGAAEVDVPPGASRVDRVRIVLAGAGERGGTVRPSNTMDTERVGLPGSSPGRTSRALRGAALAAVLLLLASCAHAPPPAPPPPQKAAKVAVALGSGAAKGFAHVGVLKVLQSQGVPVHMVVGSSAGSFVGALYAYGYDPFTLQKIALSIERDDVADFGIPDTGFLKGEKLEGWVNRMVRNTPVESMRIPFFAVATDLRRGEEVVFGKGNAGQAVRASCAVPGVFRPVRIGDALYVDGGVVSPVPVDAARSQGADVVIAVDISGKGEDNPEPGGAVDVIFTAVGIMYGRLSERQLEGADVVIRPKVGKIGSGDFTKRNEAILEGEKAAAEALPRIQAILARLRQEGRLP